MILLFSMIVIALSAGYIVSYLRKASLTSSALWFVLLTLVFFLYSFMSVWSESDFDESNGLATGTAVVSLGVFAFIAGTLLRNVMRRNSLPHVRNDRIDATSRSATIGLVTISIAILVPAWVYFYLLGSVPLFLGVGDVVDSGYSGLGAVQDYRLALTPHLAGQSIPFKGLLDTARIYGPIFIVSISIVQLLQGAPKSLRLLLICVAIVTAMAGGQRWPLIYIVVASFAAAYALVDIGTKPRLKRVMTLSGILLIAGMAITLLQKRTASVIDSVSSAFSFIFQNLFERIVFEQSATPILSFQGNHYDAGELGGMSYVQSLMAYLPGSNIQNFEVDFFSRVYNSYHGYTAAPGFFTEAYINFGYVGVVGIGLTWGFILASIDSSPIWQIDSSFTPGFKAGVVALLAGTAFAGIGLLIGGSLLFAWVLLWYWLSGRLRSSGASTETSHRLVK